ncbi:hypothetical protein K502DRAFT_352676 [Neoconidiobolus thromboides FSU 785]|nr:hypothetical protein K502DRAFT_352676 [Neoconidiobolus thromboides FSU 785]
MSLTGAFKTLFSCSLSMGSPFLINALAFWYYTALILQVITTASFIGTALGHSSFELTTFVKPKVAVIDLLELWFGTKDDVFPCFTRLDAPTLQGLGLSILVEKKVALVGASSSGKPTAIRLD